jgi:hypothetical protein
MGEGKAFVVHYRQLWDKNLEGRRFGAAHAVDLVLKMQSTASSERLDASFDCESEKLLPTTASRWFDDVSCLAKRDRPLESELQRCRALNQ